MGGSVCVTAHSATQTPLPFTLQLPMATISLSLTILIQPSISERAREETQLNLDEIEGRKERLLEEGRGLCLYNQVFGSD